MLRFFSIANISLLTRRFRDLSASRVPAIHGWNISGQLCFRPRSNLALLKYQKVYSHLSIWCIISLCPNIAFLTKQTAMLFTLVNTLLFGVQNTENQSLFRV